MRTNTDAFKQEIKSLLPEILLKIFLNLDSQETVILRSVCKEFLEVIDNNKSLWKILEWNQQEEESPLPALEMFDEKSASTIKEVSIFQAEGEPDDRLLEILRRSRDTLTDLSLKIQPFEKHLILTMIELVSDSPVMNSLVLWPSDEIWKPRFPKTRLARRGNGLPLSAQKPSDIQILWCFDLVKQGNGKLDVSSLVSFADPVFRKSDQVRSFLINFSATLVHLSINTYTDAVLPSLFCPSLRILEGRFTPRFPPWLDAPSLQIVIAGAVQGSFIGGLPVSVQELWLLSAVNSSASERLWDCLPLGCPKLKILKIGRGLFLERSEFKQRSELKTKYILEAFKVREAKVQEGVEIKGLKMVSVEKLIIPTEFFEPAELNGLRDLVAEVIDIEDYPDFIELEY